MTILAIALALVCDGLGLWLLLCGNRFSDRWRLVFVIFCFALMMLFINYALEPSDIRSEQKRLS